MLRIEVDGKEARTTMHGNLGDIAVEVMRGVHACYKHVEKRCPERAATFREYIMLVASDDAYWDQAPEVDDLGIEVDRPEDLWEEGDGDG